MSSNPDKLESNKEWPQWRIKLHDVIFETDTSAGKWFDIILLLFILGSIVVVMLETVEGFDHKYHKEIVTIEWLFTAVFSVEYIIRLISVKKPIKYAISYYGIVDLLSVLPTYLGFFIVGNQGFLLIRSLRLLRVFRILKLVRFSNASTTIRKAMLAARYKIIVFMIFIVTLITLIGSAMYLIESPTNNDFSSIPKSIYWAIVTLTTVGFGDITPQTAFGQFLASIIMILGYGIIAVPTGIVTSEFAKEHQKQQLLEHDNLNRACINCGVENHQRKARFCYRCGHDLDH